MTLDITATVRNLSAFPRSARAMLEWVRVLRSIPEFPLDREGLTGTADVIAGDDGPFLSVSVEWAGLVEMTSWSLRSELDLRCDMRAVVWMSLTTVLGRLLAEVVSDPVRSRIMAERTSRLELD